MHIGRSIIESGVISRCWIADVDFYWTTGLAP